MEPIHGDEPEPAETAADPFDQYLGSLTGLYEGFDLDALRDEWERPSRE